MAEQDFKVIREHYGDKAYAAGDTRTADPNDVKHLVPHVLEPVKKARATDAEKAEPPSANKAEKASPKNKGEG